MKGKDELKGTRSNFTPWLRDFEHQGENCLGGCCNPLRRTRVNKRCLPVCEYVVVGNVLYGAMFFFFFSSLFFFFLWILRDTMSDFNKEWPIHRSKSLFFFAIFLWGQVFVLFCFLYYVEEKSVQRPFVTLSFSLENYWHFGSKLSMRALSKIFHRFCSFRCLAVFKCIAVKTITSITSSRNLSILSQEVCP